MGNVNFVPKTVWNISKSKFYTCMGGFFFDSLKVSNSSDNLGVKIDLDISTNLSVYQLMSYFKCNSIEEEATMFENIWNLYFGTSESRKVAKEIIHNILNEKS